MAEMDHFRAAGLKNAAHDVDRGVVTVEQAGGGDKADFVSGPDLIDPGHRGSKGANDCGHERDSPRGIVMGVNDTPLRRSGERPDYTMLV